MLSDEETKNKNTLSHFAQKLGFNVLCDENKPKDLLKNFSNNNIGSSNFKNREDGDFKRRKFNSAYDNNRNNNFGDTPFDANNDPWNNHVSNQNNTWGNQAQDTNDTWGNQAQDTNNAWGNQAQDTNDAWGNEDPDTNNTWGNQAQDTNNAWGNQAQDTNDTWGNQAQDTNDTWGNQAQDTNNAWGNQAQDTNNAWGNEEPDTNNTWGNEDPDTNNTWGNVEPEKEQDRKDEASNVNDGWGNQETCGNVDWGDGVETNTEKNDIKEKLHQEIHTNSSVNRLPEENLQCSNKFYHENIQNDKILLNENFDKTPQPNDLDGKEGERSQVLGDFHDIKIKNKTDLEKPKTLIPDLHDEWQDKETHEDNGWGVEASNDINSWDVKETHKDNGWSNEASNNNNRWDVDETHEDNNGWTTKNRIQNKNNHYNNIRANRRSNNSDLKTNDHTGEKTHKDNVFNQETNQIYPRGLIKATRAQCEVNYSKNDGKKIYKTIVDEKLTTGTKESYKETIQNPINHSDNENFDQENAWGVNDDSGNQNTQNKSIEGKAEWNGKSSSDDGGWGYSKKKES